MERPSLRKIISVFSVFCVPIAIRSGAGGLVKKPDSGTQQNLASEEEGDERLIVADVRVIEF